MTDAEELAYYTAPGHFTRLESVDAASLPDLMIPLVNIVQGVLIHRAWLKAYNVEAPPGRYPEEGLHGVEAMLARIRTLDDAPITEPRAPADRMLANCRHFSTLLTAFLKLKGVPARARCGFAAYFEPGRYVDHWVCEYWHAEEGRWRMVDAQLDALQRGIIKPDFDPLDVPASAFWVAGKAWQKCRSGEADPDTFGIGDMWGEWYVSGNLCLDVAALNKIELLPWDARIIREQLEGVGDRPSIYDRMAAISLAASTRDARDVRHFYATTPEVQVSDDALRGIDEADREGAGTGANPLAGR
ncbi:MAG: transglutaminase domain-containing protein [Dehalococcoidia bacterium]